MEDAHFFFGLELLVKTANLRTCLPYKYFLTLNLTTFLLLTNALVNSRLY